MFHGYITWLNRSTENAHHYVIRQDLSFIYVTPNFHRLAGCRGAPVGCPDSSSANVVNGVQFMFMPARQTQALISLRNV